METPIIDFVKNYINKDTTRFHMPGHKGHMFFGWEPCDITEIEGADVLHHGNGIIRQSEQNAALLFGSGDTHYSTEGSTHAIKAMLCILKMERANSPRQEKLLAYESTNSPEQNTAQAKQSEHSYILAARNVHRSMVDACALLDLDLKFIERSKPLEQYNISQEGKSLHHSQLKPESQKPNSPNLLSHVVTPEALEKTLQEKQRKNELPLGVYITSPDYLGQLTDIAGLSQICKQYEIPLLVDNAHGAYLHFLQKPIHPMDLGAAMCSDSAHKTLPALTGGAYLHIHRDFTDRFSPYASQALSLFGSTSPSYLTMQSLDWCNRYLAEGYRERLADTANKLQKLKENLIGRGIPVKSSEPLKLVIDAGAMGYTGEEISHELRESQIECEYADKWQVVLMVTPENRAKDWDRLEHWADKTMMLRVRKGNTPTQNSLKKNVTLPEKENIVQESLASLSEETIPERAMSLRDAVFSAGEWVAAEEAMGRICAAETVSCPPAIPIAISGEKISAKMVQEFLNAGIQKVFVVK